MKIAQKNFVAFATIVGALGVLATVAFNVLHDSVAQGLSDSARIRVAEVGVCTPESASEPHFSGCNSIL